MVCDETKLAPLVTEYNTTKEKVKDLTDEWVGTMRVGSQATDKPRKYIKRKRVKLAMLGGALGKATGGIGGAGKEAEDYFGKDAQDADELEFSMFKMKTLLNSIRMQQDSTRSKVLTPTPSLTPSGLFFEEAHGLFVVLVSCFADCWRPRVLV